MCLSLFLLNTQMHKSSFILPSSALVLHSTSNHPSFNPLLPHCLSRGIACMPGGWLKELVRLSSQGFHLVILPLGIHTTLLPPEAACLHTDSLKETSHCHFNSPSHLPASLLSFLHRLSTPSAFLSTYFSLILFYVVFPHLPLCVPVIVYAFLIVSEQKLSAVMVVEIAAGVICGERLIWQRSQGHIHNNILLPLGHARLSGFMSVCFVHVCDCGIPVPVLLLLYVYTYVKLCGCVSAILSKVVCGHRVNKAPYATLYPQGSC